MSDLLTCIDVSEIPAELGGECTSLLSESNEEMELREFVARQQRLIDGDNGPSPSHYRSLEIEKAMNSSPSSNPLDFQDDMEMEEDLEYQVYIYMRVF